MISVPVSLHFRSGTYWSYQWWTSGLDRFQHGVRVRGKLFTFFQTLALLRVCRILLPRHLFPNSGQTALSALSEIRSHPDVKPVSNCFRIVCLNSSLEKFSWLVQRWVFYSWRSICCLNLIFYWNMKHIQSNEPQTHDVLQNFIFRVEASRG